MCGLVGIMSSNMQQKHKNALFDLLYFNTLRGRDSTGVAMLRHNADTEVMKSVVPGYDFVEGEKLSQKLRLNDFVWIGHNRFGTVGKNIKTNAHPFTVDDEDGCCLLVGAHNGTLRNRHVLPDYLQFGTDSEALYNAIALTSVEEVIPKVEGAWALTWYDHLKEEMRFLRNSERPLFYGFADNHKTLVWASEIWMIRVACTRHGIDLVDDKIYGFLEDTLYAVPAPLKINDKLEFQRTGGLVGHKPVGFFPARGQVQQWPPARPPIEERLAPRASSSAPASPVTQPPQSSQTHRERLHSESGTNSSSSGENPPTSNVLRLPQPSGKSPDPLNKTYRGFSGILLSKEQVKEAIDNGCAWCETEMIDLEKPFAWLDTNRPVCHKCLKGEEDVGPLSVDDIVTVPTTVTVH